MKPDSETTQFHCPACQGESEDTGVVFAGYPIYCCTHCGLRSAPTAFEVPVDYDEEYDAVSYQSNQVAPLTRMRDPLEFADTITYRPFFRRVKCRPGQRLLDIGCGVGRFCQAASAAGWEVKGVDPSRRAIEQGRPFASFPLVNARLEDVLETDPPYDVVTAFEVLEHLTDPVGFLRLMSQAARPGGRLFLTVPNWNNDSARHPDKGESAPPLHLCFYTERALAAVAAMADLSEIKVGVISADALPLSNSAKLRWVRRRLLRRPNLQAGLWLSGRVGRGQ